MRDPLRLALGEGAGRDPLVPVLALPKGRLLEPTLDLLGRGGWRVPAGKEMGNTQLTTMVNGPCPLMLVLTRAEDVPTYVEYGAVDLGVVGKDILRERGSEVCEVLDLGVGFCRLALAFPRDRMRELWPPRLPLRVATSFPRQAAAFLQERQVAARVLVVRGTAELAPLVGLADGIVDLVATGRTLAQHYLAVAEVISTSTARLIAHPGAMRLGSQGVSLVIDTLRELAQDEGSPGEGSSENGIAPRR